MVIAVVEAKRVDEKGENGGSTSDEEEVVETVEIEAIGGRDGAVALVGT